MAGSNSGARKDERDSGLGNGRSVVSSSKSDPESESGNCQVKSVLVAYNNPKYMITTYFLLILSTPT